MKWINVDKKLPPTGVDLIVHGVNKYTMFRNGHETHWHVRLNPKVYNGEEVLRSFLIQYKITHYIILSPIPKV